MSSKKSATSSRLSGIVFDLDGMRMRVSDIELQMQDPHFWDNHEKAGALSKTLNAIKTDLIFWEHLQEQIDFLNNLSDEELAVASDDVYALRRNFATTYNRLFLSGVYDQNPAILSIHAGAGGVDAQDWATMLFEMYKGYCKKNNFDVSVVDISYGEQGGIKNATLEIHGDFSYGMLKYETGVHRLVRISPFSAKQLRHTSFALVDVIPMIEKLNFEISSSDIKIDTFKSSGPGGQNVNKLETAIRLTHTPTGIVVSVQSERSQAQNREKAMQILSSKIAKLMEQHHAKQLSELRSNVENLSIEWGSQIRSYVLNPYQLVKDHRTGYESSQPNAVLEGDLDEFIRSEIVTLSPQSQ